MLRKMADGQAFPQDRADHESWATELWTAADNIEEGWFAMWDEGEMDVADHEGHTASHQTGLARYKAGMQWVTDNVGLLWD